MAKRMYPSNVIEQAQDLLTGWNQIAPVPTYGTLTTASFSTDVAAATTIEGQIATLEAQLTDKRLQRDAAFKALWDKSKKVRSSVKGSFGDDSPQYKLVGGTRLSDKKPRTRKAPAA
jgi:hypothetical protein